MIKTRLYGFIAVFILNAIVLKAQDKPIGYWDSYLPYNSSVGVVSDGNTVYNICNQGFFTINKLTNTVETYSKVNGMSDIGMSCIAYDAATSTVVLVYKDGNIDLFKDNTFYNIPDFKIKTISGAKVIYNAYTENGIAYLSTSIGVLVIDLATHNITETYKFTANGGLAAVKDFIGVADSFYAVTSIGLYKARKSNPELQNFAVWTLVDNASTFSSIASANNDLYLANPTSVYKLINGVATPIYVPDSATIEHIDGIGGKLYISEYVSYRYFGRVKIVDNSGSFVDSFTCPGVPVRVAQTRDSVLWISDSYRGLQFRVATTGNNQVSYYVPPGPWNVNAYDIIVKNGDLWVAHGGFNDTYGPNFNRDGLSHFSGSWKWFGLGINIAFDTIRDICSVVKDDKKGNVYATSFLDGLVTINPANEVSVIKLNSIFDSTYSFGRTQRQMLGAAMDKYDNLWLGSYQAPHALNVRTADSNWYKFALPGITNGGPIVTDDNGQVWIAGVYGQGVGVYYTNNTPGDPSDDSYYKLSAGLGNGNLPSNNIFCLAKDKNDNIWIGSDNGIGIVSNCNAPFTGTQPCDAQLPIVQYDQYAGYLFAGNNVRTIAVDGANRKWVGTDAGVWLLSSDASQIIFRFTKDNSPLPSNMIQKIAVDDVTGDVYIGTDQGLVSYRSTATEGSSSNSNVIIFPDPVPAGYNGTIAIKGLTANADVRITDISGQLVYRTKALGGQAVWNGMDYKGHRPQSGVYLVFVSSSDGSQTFSGKLVFLQ